MQKNDVVEVSIADIGITGEGIGKVDGFPLFIKDAIIGDVVEAKVIKSKKNYAYAKLTKIIEPSPYRVPPRCPYARQCGGCQIQEMAYQKQLEFKQNKVKNNLERIGGFSAELLEQIIEPIIGMEEPFHYRNKAQFPFGTDKDGQPITGFYAGRTHHIIANTDCPLGVAVNEEILETILAYMKKYKITTYNEATGKGLIRHTLIRYGFHTKEIMVCLVINASNESKESSKSNKSNKSLIPHKETLIEGLKKIDGMTSIAISNNPKNTNVIMGDFYEVLWGQGYITDSIGSIFYQISPLSFYQVNSIQTEKLYGIALEYAALQGHETVWDLYCGIGTISLFLAQKAKQVYGVEIVPEAVADAGKNAELNQIDNANFFLGKAEEVLPAYYKKHVQREDDKHKEQAVSKMGKQTEDGHERKMAEECEQKMDLIYVQQTVEENEQKRSSRSLCDVIVVDPPRKGCEESLLETIVKMEPQKIVYVSCDSATLARDLQYLCKNGYELKKVRATDMFPMTVHVETVALLEASLI